MRKFGGWFLIIVAWIPIIYGGYLVWVAYTQHLYRLGIVIVAYEVMGLVISLIGHFVKRRDS
jgi:undecaprenyl pyrophosphate phosphatase UppP